jgi:hypothetical protein
MEVKGMSECSKSSKLNSCQGSSMSGENHSKEASSKDINEFWFSYRERRWDVKKELEGWVNNKSKFFWTGEVEVWDYPACCISLVRAADEKLKIVVRRKKPEHSDFLDKYIEIRRMIGFDLEKVYKPWTETYTARENEGNREVIAGLAERWVFQFNEKCWVWEWAKEGQLLEDSHIYRFYKSICEEISTPSLKCDNIFDVNDVIDIDPESEDGITPRDIYPVIYQPAVDCMKNFVRYVHCTPCKMVDGCCEVEVSLVFNNEQLRQHSFFNNIYEVIRYYLYGRTLDIETFRIRFKKDIESHKLIFQNIYSGKNDLEQDSIHGDSIKPAPEHDVKYYFIQKEHPVIFINTSNHSMAEHDANHSLWKWEYIPWLDNAPIEFGHKNRNQIEAENEGIITREIENKPPLSRYILRMAQKYRKVKQLST